MHLSLSTTGGIASVLNVLSLAFLCDSPIISFTSLYPCSSKKAFNSFAIFPYILPGGIDAHTHFDLDVGVTRTADNFETGTKAALVGGTTTIIDYANHIKGQRFLDDLRYYSTLTDGRCYCDYSYHLSITEWNQDFSKEMGEMVLRGIPSFKMYMAYKDTLQVEDYEIEEALRKAKELGIILSFHCEDGDEIVKNVSNLLLEGKTEPKFHEISRGDEVELAAVKRILDISEKVDYPVYIVHLSTKKL